MHSSCSIRSNRLLAAEGSPRNRSRGVWVISDEVYNRFCYTRAGRAPSMLDIAEDADRVLVVNSFSKTWRMTGWRLGWLVIPAELLGQFKKLNEFNVASPTSFVQAAGVTALTCEAEVGRFIAHCDANRRRTLSALRQCVELIVPDIDGAFYAFFRLIGAQDSLQLARDLLLHHRVGLAPGIAFGAAGEGWLRLCFAVSTVTLDKGLERLLSFVRNDLPSAGRMPCSK